MPEEKIRIDTIKQMKAAGKKIVVLTAYDYPVARLLDEAKVDIILVGDSLGMVVLGYPTTIQVTMQEMIHHCRAVSRAVSRSLLVGDMPFMTYKVNAEQALRNSARMIQEGRMEAVKIEGGQEMSHIINHLVKAGLAVMGHIGLTPQSIHLLSGYKVQGKDNQGVKRLLSDAKAVEQAGAFSIVLEAMPEEVGKIITESLTIPTIGIGAGRYCDGQVLVINDMLGLSFAHLPRFVKQYANLKDTIKEATERFISEVRQGQYPDDKHRYT